MSYCSECDRPMHAQGLCSGHYTIMLKAAAEGLRPRLDMTPLQRYLVKVETRGLDECWPWRAHRSKKNYGQVADGKHGSMPAHRFGFAALVRPLKPDETVDHTCHGKDPDCQGGDACEHRACQNPAHWDAVSGLENVARGRSFSAVNARKTHCVHGHELTSDNSYGWHGRRQCKTCARNRARRQHEKIRAARQG